MYGRTVGQLNHNAVPVIEQHLEPGERLLWSGQPKQGVRFRGSDIFMVPFSLLWGGFAFFWEFSVIVGGAPLFFALVGLPFVLFGVYLIAGRFYVEAQQRRKTYYGVSANRVVIISGLFRQTVRSLPLRTLSDISLTESRDGATGSIRFGNASPFTSWFGGHAWPGMEGFSAPRLDTIEDPKQVYRIIRDAQASAR